MAASPHVLTRRDAPRGREIRVRGIVQGVGFRPFVWRLAREHALDGSVCNDGEGVLIRVRGGEEAQAAFLEALCQRAPPLARIERIEVRPLTAAAPAGNGFRILESGGGAIRTQVSPDVATCPDCLAEVLSRGDRRSGHPFANCTHCGPRFSILRALPYDRANTSMADFPLCPECRREYHDPADRRFHAQPVACPGCGPRLWLAGADGEEIPAADPLARAVALLRAGRILAVKGVGGFHLVVDATNAGAVTELRRRKCRPARPLALMARDLAVIRRYRSLSHAETLALEDRSAPIVLLETPGPESLPGAIAPGMRCLGFLLPFSPLHHLLLRDFDTPLVFTSGNRSGHPQCTDNRQALAQLGGIADAFLLHDREIVNRVDDSVLRLFEGRTQPLRRGRGLAPAPLPLPPGLGDSPPVLALGGELKNTFCLLQHGRVVLSQHIGDLEQPATWREWLAALERHAALYEFRPSILAIDSHPAYRSSAHGRELAAAEGMELAEIQHHHAHLAACMAEHGIGLEEGPVLGIVLDGIGHGEDGTGWGGELLLGDYLGFERLARLRPAPLPGGELAMLEPWRNLAARLLADGDTRSLIEPGSEVPALRDLARRPLKTLQAMIAKEVNSPPASSTGRLFDAVAALLGLAPERLGFEGQAAMLLEQAAAVADTAHPCHLAVRLAATQVEIDPAPLWPELARGLAGGVPVPALALGFHQALAAAWTEVAFAAARRYQVSRVVLSGGVMQNRLLLEALCRALRENGLEVLCHHQVPANDGGLSLGQACIAAARHVSSRR